jgi:hypothetical protein
MYAFEFWQTVVRDRVDFLGKVLSLLAEHTIHYCVIGGQAVNAYTEPVVSLDLAIAVATADLGKVEGLIGKEFRIERFEHSINISMYGSDLRVQIQTDPRYSEFPSRAESHEVLGVSLPVASLQDLLQGKIWAILDNARRSSKRQKDLADISRLLEAHPRLRECVPDEILQRLF